MAYSDELYHYGVLGMKWGIHKARKYAMDTNRYIRDRQDKKTTAKYQEGNMTTNDFIKTMKRHESEMKRKNREVIRKTSQITPEKGKKISSIYGEYRNEALRTIPHYRVKQGAKIAKMALFDIGETAVFSMLGPGGLAGISAITFAKNAATSIAIDAALTPVMGLAFDELDTRAARKKR